MWSAQRAGRRRGWVSSPLQAQANRALTFACHPAPTCSPPTPRCTSARPRPAAPTTEPWASARRSAVGLWVLGAGKGAGCMSSRPLRIVLLGSSRVRRSTAPCHPRKPRPLSHHPPADHRGVAAAAQGASHARHGAGCDGVPRPPRGAPAAPPSAVACLRPVRLALSAYRWA